ncbi:serine-rich adhesin for platelets-like [Pelobates cultripes]|uniref:Serine-rich adhesin for platelets-like, partial n=1 Tax=Pelobates cultripes TaxID=61616 RepID=A0AAD1VU78_PELCU|nr:serine-rich adhesin for platelets-like [Pelobates cultripes]
MTSAPDEISISTGISTPIKAEPSTLTVSDIYSIQSDPQPTSTNSNIYFSTDIVPSSTLKIVPSTSKQATMAITEENLLTTVSETSVSLETWSHVSHELALTLSTENENPSSTAENPQTVDNEEIISTSMETSLLTSVGPDATTLKETDYVSSFPFDAKTTTLVSSIFQTVLTGSEETKSDITDEMRQSTVAAESLSPELNVYTFKYTDISTSLDTKLPLTRTETPLTLEKETMTSTPEEISISTGISTPIKAEPSTLTVSETYSIQSDPKPTSTNSNIYFATDIVPSSTLKIVPSTTKQATMAITEENLLTKVSETSVSLETWSHVSHELSLTLSTENENPSSTAETPQTVDNEEMISTYLETAVLTTIGPEATTLKESDYVSSFPLDAKTTTLISSTFQTVLTGSEETKSDITDEMRQPTVAAESISPEVNVYTFKYTDISTSLDIKLPLTRTETPLTLEKENDFSPEEISISYWYIYKYQSRTINFELVSEIYSASLILKPKTLPIQTFIFLQILSSTLKIVPSTSKQATTTAITQEHLLTTVSETSVSLETWSHVSHELALTLSTENENPSSTAETPQIVDNEEIISTSKETTVLTTIGPDTTTLKESDYVSSFPLDAKTTTLVSSTFQTVLTGSEETNSDRTDERRQSTVAAESISPELNVYTFKYTDISTSLDIKLPLTRTETPLTLKKETMTSAPDEISISTGISTPIKAEPSTLTVSEIYSIQSDPQPTSTNSNIYFSTDIVPSSTLKIVPSTTKQATMAITEENLLTKVSETSVSLETWSHVSHELALTLSTENENPSSTAETPQTVDNEEMISTYLETAVLTTIGPEATTLKEIDYVSSFPLDAKTTTLVSSIFQTVLTGSEETKSDITNEMRQSTVAAESISPELNVYTFKYTDISTSLDTKLPLTRTETPQTLEKEKMTSAPEEISISTGISTNIKAEPSTLTVSEIYSIQSDPKPTSTNSNIYFSTDIVPSSTLKIVPSTTKEATMAITEENLLTTVSETSLSLETWSHVSHELALTLSTENENPSSNAETIQTVDNEEIISTSKETAVLTTIGPDTTTLKESDYVSSFPLDAKTTTLVSSTFQRVLTGSEETKLDITDERRKSTLAAESISPEINVYTFKYTDISTSLDTKLPLTRTETPLTLEKETMTSTPEEISISTGISTPIKAEPSTLTVSETYSIQSDPKPTSTNSNIYFATDIVPSSTLKIVPSTSKQATMAITEENLLTTVSETSVSLETWSHVSHELALTLSTENENPSSTAETPQTVDNEEIISTSMETTVLTTIGPDTTTLKESDYVSSFPLDAKTTTLVSSTFQTVLTGSEETNSDRTVERRQSTVAAESISPELNVYTFKYTDISTSLDIKLPLTRTETPLTLEKETMTSAPDEISISTGISTSIKAEPSTLEKEKMTSTPEEISISTGISTSIKAEPSTLTVSETYSIQSDPKPTSTNSNIYFATDIVPSSTLKIVPSTSKQATTTAITQEHLLTTVSETSVSLETWSHISHELALTLSTENENPSSNAETIQTVDNEEIISTSKETAVLTTIGPDTTTLKETDYVSSFPLDAKTTTLVSSTFQTVLTGSEETKLDITDERRKSTLAAESISPEINVYTFKYTDISTSLDTKLPLKRTETPLTLEKETMTSTAEEISISTGTSTTIKEEPSTLNESKTYSIHSDHQPTSTNFATDIVPLSTLKIVPSTSKQATIAITEENLLTTVSETSVSLETWSHVSHELALTLSTEIENPSSTAETPQIVDNEKMISTSTETALLTSVGPDATTLKETDYVSSFPLDAKTTTSVSSTFQTMLTGSEETNSDRTDERRQSTVAAESISHEINVYTFKYTDISISLDTKLPLTRTETPLTLEKEKITSTPEEISISTGISTNIKAEPSTLTVSEIYSIQYDPKPTSTNSNIYFATDIVPSSTLKIVQSTTKEATMAITEENLITTVSETSVSLETWSHVSHELALTLSTENENPSSTAETPQTVDNEEIISTSMETSLLTSVGPDATTLKETDYVSSFPLDAKTTTLVSSIFQTVLTGSEETKSDITDEMRQSTVAAESLSPELNVYTFKYTDISTSLDTKLPLTRTETPLTLEKETMTSTPEEISISTGISTPIKAEPSTLTVSETYSIQSDPKPTSTNSNIYFATDIVPSSTLKIVPSTTKQATMAITEENLLTKVSETSVSLETWSHVSHELSLTLSTENENPSSTAETPQTVDNEEMISTYLETAVLTTIGPEATTLKESDYVSSFPLDAKTTTLISSTFQTVLTGSEETKSDITDEMRQPTVAAESISPEVNVYTFKYTDISTSLDIKLPLTRTETPLTLEKETMTSTPMEISISTGKSTPIKAEPSTLTVSETYSIQSDPKPTSTNSNIYFATDIVPSSTLKIVPSTTKQATMAIIEENLLTKVSETSVSLETWSHVSHELALTLSTENENPSSTAETPQTVDNEEMISTYLETALLKTIGPEATTLKESDYVSSFPLDAKTTTLVSSIFQTVLTGSEETKSDITDEMRQSTVAAESISPELNVYTFKYTDISTSLDTKLPLTRTETPQTLEKEKMTSTPEEISISTGISTNIKAEPSTLTVSEIYSIQSDPKPTSTNSNIYFSTDIVPSSTLKIVPSTSKQATTTAITQGNLLTTVSETSVSLETWSHVSHEFVLTLSTENENPSSAAETPQTVDNEEIISTSMETSLLTSVGPDATTLKETDYVSSFPLDAKTTTSVSSTFQTMLTGSEETNSDRSDERRQSTVAAESISPELNVYTFKYTDISTFLDTKLPLTRTETPLTLEKETMTSTPEEISISTGISTPIKAEPSTFTVTETYSIQSDPHPTSTNSNIYFATDIVPSSTLKIVPSTSKQATMAITEENLLTTVSETSVSLETWSHVSHELALTLSTENENPSSTAETPQTVDNEEMISTYLETALLTTIGTEATTLKESDYVSSFPLDAKTTTLISSTFQTVLIGSEETKSDITDEMRQPTVAAESISPEVNVYTFKYTDISTSLDIKLPLTRTETPLTLEKETMTSAPDEISISTGISTPIKAEPSTLTVSEIYSIQSDPQPTSTNSNIYFSTDIVPSSTLKIVPSTSKQATMAITEENLLTTVSETSVSLETWSHVSHELALTLSTENENPSSTAETPQTVDNEEMISTYLETALLTTIGTDATTLKETDYVSSFPLDAKTTTLISSTFQTVLTGSEETKSDITDEMRQSTVAAESLSPELNVYTFKYTDISTSLDTKLPLTRTETPLTLEKETMTSTPEEISISTGISTPIKAEPSTFTVTETYSIQSDPQPTSTNSNIYFATDIVPSSTLKIVPSTSKQATMAITEENLLTTVSETSVSLETWSHVSHEFALTLSTENENPSSTAETPQTVDNEEMISTYLETAVLTTIGHEATTLKESDYVSSFPLDAKITTLVASTFQTVLTGSEETKLDITDERRQSTVAAESISPEINVYTFKYTDISTSLDTKLPLTRTETPLTLEKETITSTSEEIIIATGISTPSKTTTTMVSMLSSSVIGPTHSIQFNQSTKSSKSNLPVATDMIPFSSLKIMPPTSREASLIITEENLITTVGEESVSTESLSYISRGSAPTITTDIDHKLTFAETQHTINKKEIDISSTKTSFSTATRSVAPTLHLTETAPPTGETFNLSTIAVTFKSTTTESAPIYTSLSLKPTSTSVTTFQQDVSKLTKTSALDVNHRLSTFPISTSIIQDINACKSNPCRNGATCKIVDSTFYCICQKGYSGKFCEIDMDDCAGSPCMNGAICVDKVNGFDCRCQKGWHGITCTVDVDECFQGSTTCDKHAVCINTLGSFRCSCDEGYKGDGFICNEKRLFDYGPEVGDIRATKKSRDFASPVINIPMGFPFEYIFYNNLYFTDNGVIIFQRKSYDPVYVLSYPYKTFQSNDASSPPVIAPFWADTDLSGGIGELYYQVYNFQSSVSDSSFKESLENSINSYFNSSLEKEFRAVWAVKITWDNVLPLNALYYSKSYSSTYSNNTNTFQAVLATDGVYSFALILFEDGGMKWRYNSLPIQHRPKMGYFSGITRPKNTGNFPAFNDPHTEPSTSTEQIYTPDQSKGYNTGMNGRWAYRLDTNTQDTVNPRSQCLKWYYEEPALQFNTPPCPCSFRQAMFDSSYIDGFNLWYYGFDVKDFSGFLFGDPHMSTLDGVSYTFNGLGEFTLANIKNENNDVIFRIQGRTARAENGTGNATNFVGLAAYTSLGGQVQWTLLNDNATILSYNGTIIPLSENVTYIDHVALEKTANGEVKGTFDSGISLSVTATLGVLNFVVLLDSVHQNRTEGLLGLYNGNPNDDFMFADGHTLPYSGNIKPKESEIYIYGMTWKTTPENSIFTYINGESWFTYNNNTFIPMFFDELISTSDSETLQKANEICDGNMNCVFDILSTKDFGLGMLTKKSDQAFTSQRVVMETFPPNISGSSIVMSMLNVQVMVGYSISSGQLYLEATSSDLVIRENGSLLWLPTSSVPVFAIIRANNSVATAELGLTLVLCNCSNGGVCDYDKAILRSEKKNSKFMTAACNCSDSWDGEFCTENFNACLDNHCFNTSSCVDNPALVNGFQCSPCPSGLSGDGIKCSDIDECYDNISDCEQICTNTLTGYECSCKEGYKPDQQNSSRCEDINECNEVSKCAENADCFNYPGNYSCMCRDGYSGDPHLICTDINECATGSSSFCSNTSICINTNGSFNCECLSGYTGINCSDAEPTVKTPWSSTMKINSSTTVHGNKTNETTLHTTTLEPTVSTTYHLAKTSPLPISSTSKANTIDTVDSSTPLPSVDSRNRTSTVVTNRKNHTKTPLSTVHPQDLQTTINLGTITNGTNKVTGETTSQNSPSKTTNMSVSSLPSSTTATTSGDVPLKTSTV